jgi:hypothetical protein
MTNNDDWAMRCSGTESVKGRWLQEGIKTWQVLNLGNELLAVIQKLLFSHNAVAIWIHPFEVIVSINIVV